MASENRVLVIDNDLRTIRVPEGVKHLGVECDDGVLGLRFQMPREYNGIDLAGFEIRINYLNASKEGDVDIVKSKTITADSIGFTWFVSRFATRTRGEVEFNVCLKKMDGTTVIQEFNTTSVTLPVLKGLETTEKVKQDYPDLLRQWREDILGKFRGEVDKTLSISGQAADAAATGRKISEVTTTLSSKANKNELNVQKERIDQLIAQREQVADDAELFDIRVGADGVTYPNAGEAVRTQFRNTFHGYSEEITYTCTESSTYPLDRLIEKGKRYRIKVEFGGNVSKLDIGYTADSGEDIVFVNTASSGAEYDYTPNQNGTRFRFWTYLATDMETSVVITLTTVGLLERESEVELNLKDVNRHVKALYDQTAIPLLYEHTLRMGNTMALDIEQEMIDGENYILQINEYTGNNLQEVQIYLFNSMSDHIKAGTLHEPGESLVFEGSSKYKYVRVYAMVSAAETYPSNLVVKLGRYGDDSLVSRVDALENKLDMQADKPNILILGDSYSQMGYWVESLRDLADIGDVVNLGVSSATLKDRYADRILYPYDSRPVSNDPRGGNVNTFSSQIEKLKRLMLGEDLDSGEKKIYETESSHPDIILIQGGTNDQPDSTTAEYVSQIYTVKSGYIKRRSESTPWSGYIKIPTEYEDTKRTVFAGAMRYLYGVLHEMFPNAFIFFITPCGLTYMSGGEHKYLEKGEQIKYAASLLSTPVIDWGVNGRLSLCDNAVTGAGTEDNPYIYDAPGEYSADALHPNRSGARFLAMEVAKVLRDYDLA